MLVKMQEAKFVDLATRAVIIDFSLYNGPLKLFSCIRLLYELPPMVNPFIHSQDLSGGLVCAVQGGIIRKFKMLYADIYRFESPAQIISALMSFMVVAYCYWFLSTEIQDMRRSRHGRVSLYKLITTYGYIYLYTTYYKSFYLIIK